MQKKKYRKDNKKTKLIGYLWMEKGHKEGKRERNSREEKEWHFSEYIYAFPIGWVSETYNALCPPNKWIIKIKPGCGDTQNRMQMATNEPNHFASD